tara:strand:- start:5488 stop:5661 length:174 start_codon:yes stop_codon:yes gene_type:complete
MKDNNFLELVLDTKPQRIKVKHEEVFSCVNVKNGKNKTKSKAKVINKNKKVNVGSKY